MSWREFTVEVLRILLGAPVATAIVVLTLVSIFRADLRALMRRIATLKFPGGELTTSQSEVSAREETKQPDQLPPAPEEPLAIPREITLSPENQELLVDLIKAERARAAFWEYKFLNFFLVTRTQRVLDWLASLPQRVTVQAYDAFLSQWVSNPEERLAVLNALRDHHLIQNRGDLIEVTPKGREYLAWRGPLPELTT